MTLWRDRTEQLIADAAAKAENGLTWQEVGELLHTHVAALVAEARTLANPGFEKKRLVLVELARLFDTIAQALPLPGWAKLLRSVVLPWLRRHFLSLADGQIEATYSWQKANVPLEPDP